MKFTDSTNTFYPIAQLAPRAVAVGLLGLLLPVMTRGAIAADAPDAVGMRFEQSAAVNQASLTQTWVNHEITYQETGVEYK
jgi:hypothetical protein